MKYELKKIIEVSTQKLNIMPFDSTKIQIKKGYLYCYTESNTGRKQKVLRLGFDKSVLLKNILNDEKVYCYYWIFRSEHTPLPPGFLHPHRLFLTV